jgi:hypothetical protein
MTTISCPECGGDAIPVGMAPDKTIGLFWICSDCPHRWHYWEKEDLYYERAQKFITNPYYPLTQVEP